MKQTLIIMSVLVTLNSCNQECEEIVSKHDNGKAEVLHKYPDCSDSTTYQRDFYFDNGQLGSSGFMKKGKKDGLFKSWNKEGVQTAEWHMKQGVEHGHVQCWYDNGTKSKETNLNEGKVHGFERTWLKNGDLASIGEYSNGKQIGTWKYFEETGTWKIRNYQDGELHGLTNEHLIDSIGKVTIVIGQYENDTEVGMWKWFDKDSTLTQTAIFDNGKATGEIIEYHQDGSIKLKGNLIDGRYDGEVKYFDKNGNLIKTEIYEEGDLKNN